MSTMPTRGRICTMTVCQILVVASLLSAGTNAFVPVNQQVRYRNSYGSPPTLSAVVPRRIPASRKPQPLLQTATATTASINPSPTVKRSLFSASSLVVLDILFRRLFQALSISFPSSLAGCGVLLVSLLTLPFGNKLYNALSPGATLLAKWLPVFFVPSMVTLPLADGLGSPVEVSFVYSSCTDTHAHENSHLVSM